MKHFKKVKYLFKLINYKIIISNFIFASKARIIIKCDENENLVIFESEASIFTQPPIH